MYVVLGMDIKHLNLKTFLQGRLSRNHFPCFPGEEIALERGHMTCRMAVAEPELRTLLKRGLLSPGWEPSLPYGAGLRGPSYRPWCQ